MTIADKIARAKTDYDNVYSAGVEAGKSQGTSKPTLYGTYVLKEPITYADVPENAFVYKTFENDNLYTYFYDENIRDYQYVKVSDWWFDNGRIDIKGYVGDIEFWKFALSDWDGIWRSCVDVGNYAIHPDIKGRIVIFTEPTEVSEDFYNLFTQNIDTEIDIFGEGEESGVAEGIEQGIEQGKQAEYDRFWDAYQENGNRNDYGNAFAGYYWSADTFRPKYHLKVKKGGGMFTNFSWRIPNTIETVDISHISIDVTEATDCYNMFSNANIKSVTLIFGDKITTLNNAFTKSGGAGKPMDNITLLVPNPNCDWTNAFSYHGVKELNLLPGTVIGTNGFNIRWAVNLPKSNLISIINALSKDTSGLSVTLSKNAVNKAFETSEGANDGSTSAEWLELVATKSNWTVALA